MSLIVPLVASALSAASVLQTQETWHNSLGHSNEHSMRLLRKGLSTGIDYDELSQIPFVACIKDKQTRLPFNTVGRQRAGDFLDWVHADICGPSLKRVG